MKSIVDSTSDGVYALLPAFFPAHRLFIGTLALNGSEQAQRKYRVRYDRLITCTSSKRIARLPIELSRSL